LGLNESNSFGTAGSVKAVLIQEVGGGCKPTETMKTSPARWFFAGVFSLSLLFAPHVGSTQGTIVPHNIIFSQPAGAPPGTYLTQVAYPGDAGGLFALSVSTINVGQYRLDYYGIAESYSIHAATAGLAFTPAYVLGDAPLLNNANNPGEFQFSLSVGQSILLAYWDNALYQFGSSQPGAPGTPGPDEYDAYGWFRLTRTVSGLTIADSATAMGRGIVVGTYNAVPEPTVASFVALALLVGLARRRKQVLQ
jgi:hypothetical protein